MPRGPEVLGSKVSYTPNILTGWWFQRFFISPLPGEMIQLDSYFSDGLVQPPTSVNIYK